MGGSIDQHAHTFSRHIYVYAFRENPDTISCAMPVYRLFHARSIIHQALLRLVCDA